LRPAEIGASFVQRHSKMLVANQVLDVLLVRANRLLFRAKCSQRALEVAEEAIGQIE
jgi:hypothetical protein